MAIRHLVENIKKHNYTLTTGFIGTPYLNLVLSDNGYDDVAYKLFEQTAYPSWLYPVLQGATTIWERWNSYTLVNGFGPVDMNSFNHYSYGAIEEWMIAYTLGIQRDEEQPAYKHIILQPRIGGTFSFIRGHYDSAYGRIESGWQIQKKGYIYEATIPANTTATLYLPAKSEKSVRMEKGQEGITPVGLKDLGKIRGSRRVCGRILEKYWTSRRVRGRILEKYGAYIGCAVESWRNATLLTRCKVRFCKNDSARPY